MVLTISLFAALVALFAARWLARIAPAQREPSVVPITYRPGSAPPVPRVGGVAVYVAVLAALGLAAVVGAPSMHRVLDRGGVYGGLLAGATLLLVVGLADDFLDLSPAVKLLAQGLAAMFAVSGGLVVRLVQFGPSATMDLGWVSIPLTVFWIIAVTNAFNFIDGLDGLAPSIGIVGFAATLVSALALGRTSVVIVSATVIGALFGFLRYNFAPARIYLGDCGSLLIGYLLSTLSLLGATSTANSALVYVPLFALALPLLDAAVAIARRTLRRVPIWKGDHRHIHHRVQALGLNKRQSVAVLALVAAVAAAAGLATSLATPTLFVAIALVSAGAIAILAVGGLRRLDYYEFTALRTALAVRPASWRRFVREEIRMRDAERELATARDLNDLRTGLDRCALAFGLDRVEISRQRPRLRRSWRGEHFDVPVGGGATPPTGDDWSLRVWYGEYDSPEPELVQRAAHVLARACGRWLESYGLLTAPPWSVAVSRPGSHEGPTLPRRRPQLAKA